MFLLPWVLQKYGMKQLDKEVLDPASVPQWEKESKKPKFSGTIYGYSGLGK